MRKLLTAFALIISSFFFCNYVYAATYEYTITDEEISYVSSDDFEIVRDAAIEYCKENDMYYRIGYAVNQAQYEILYYEKNDFTLTDMYSYGVHLYPRIKRQYVYYKDGVFSDPKELSATYDRFYYNNNFYYTSYLDTNIPNLIFDFSYTDKSIILLIHYNERDYEFSHGTTFKSLYEIYIEPDYTIISNFYTLVIEKICLLTELIVQNPIYLFIFVILILIFLIELTRRYLLWKQN